LVADVHGHAPEPEPHTDPDGDTHPLEATDRQPVVEVARPGTHKPHVEFTVLTAPPVGYQTDDDCAPAKRGAFMRIRIEASIEPSSARIFIVIV
jgi:hypothetical protein